MGQVVGIVYRTCYASEQESWHRVRVTPARRGKREKTPAPSEQDPTPAERWAGMTWAPRLKRVFHPSVRKRHVPMPLLDIDIETCSECGGGIKLIACIEDPMAIGKILAYRNEKAASAAKACCRNCRRERHRVSSAGVGHRDASNQVGHRRLSACNAQADKLACSTHPTNHSALVAALQHSGRASVGLRARSG